MVIRFFERRFTLLVKHEIRDDAYWFGEAQGRVVVSCTKQDAEMIKQKARLANIPVTEIGMVTGGNIKVNAENWGEVIVWKEQYDTAIEKLLN